MQKMSSIEDGSLSGNRNNEYYASGGRGLNDRASSSDSHGPYNDMGSGRIGNHVS